MKKLKKTIFIIIFVIFNIVGFNHIAYADVIYPQPAKEALDKIFEGFGYRGFSLGHGMRDMSKPIYRREPYWETNTLFINLAITFILILLIILILRKIMKVKTNASNKKICWIISAVLVGIYMIFGTLMVVNMIENNSKVSDYGLYVDEYMASYFSYKYNGNLNVSRYEIIEFLENIKKEYTLRGTENHFNNYNYIDVDLEIKTADYNYSNKCSADDAMTVLLTQINEKLNNKIYYMKVITNEKFITGIIISDERIR